ncbi:unnamed protein product, partial [Prorocentrum cordatum]
MTESKSINEVACNRVDAKREAEAKRELNHLEGIRHEAARTAESEHQLAKQAQSMMEAECKAKAERNLTQQSQSMAEAVREAKVEVESKLVEAERPAEHFEGMLHEAERKAEAERKLATLKNCEFADETTTSIFRQAALAGYGVAQLLKEAAGL